MSRIRLLEGRFSSPRMKSILTDIPFLKLLKELGWWNTYFGSDKPLLIIWPDKIICVITDAPTPVISAVKIFCDNPMSNLFEAKR
jgi:hypothetical protein